MLVILIIGTNSSGSSCIAGILYNLGIDMGTMANKTTKKTGYYEDRPFKSLQATRPYSFKIKWLNEWVEYRCRKEFWALKHPSLCRPIWTAKVIECIYAKAKTEVEIRVISCERNRQSIIESACDKYATEVGGLDLKLKAWTGKIDVLLAQKEETLSLINGELMRVSYEFCIKHPETGVRMISEFCFRDIENKPTKEQINDAICFIDPQRKHF